MADKLKNLKIKKLAIKLISVKFYNLLWNITKFIFTTNFQTKTELWKISPNPTKCVQWLSMCQEEGSS